MRHSRLEYYFIRLVARFTYVFVTPDDILHFMIKAYLHVIAYLR